MNKYTMKARDYAYVIHALLLFFVLQTLTVPIFPLEFSFGLLCNLPFRIVRQLNKND